MPWAPKPLRRELPPKVELKGGSAERGYDAKWQRLRAAVLAREPFCRRCDSKGIVTEAVHVDHIVPLSEGGARLEDTNLQPLCVQCHVEKTAEDVARRSGRK